MSIPKYAFEDVLKDYFPRWNHKGWKIRFYFNGEKTKFFPGIEYNNVSASCNRESKVIALFDEEAGINDIVRTNFIHEACHAVTRGRHNKEFFKRMMKCRLRALELGDNMIAGLIMIDMVETKLDLKTDYDLTQLEREVKHEESTKS